MVQNARKALLQKQVRCLSAISAPSPTGAGLTFRRKFPLGSLENSKRKVKRAIPPFPTAYCDFHTGFLTLEIPLGSALSQNNLTKGKGVVFDQYSQLLTKPSWLTKGHTRSSVLNNGSYLPGYPESCFSEGIARWVAGIHPGRRNTGKSQTNETMTCPLKKYCDCQYSFFNEQPIHSTEMTECQRQVC